MGYHRVIIGSPKYNCMLGMMSPDSGVSEDFDKADVGGQCAVVVVACFMVAREPSPPRRLVVFRVPTDGHAEGGRGRLRAQGQPSRPACAQEGRERTLQARQLRERRQVLHDRHRPVEYAASTGSFPVSLFTRTTASPCAPASAVASASTSASASNATTAAVA